MGEEVNNFYELVRGHKELSDFFAANKLSTDPVKINSRWDIKNQIFLAETAAGKFVLKQINESDWSDEIAHYHRLNQTYPGFLPKIICESENNIVMEFIDGEDLLSVFRRPFSETAATVERLGHTLIA